MSNVVKLIDYPQTFFLHGVRRHFRSTKPTREDFLLDTEALKMPEPLHESKVEIVGSMFWCVPGNTIGLVLIRRPTPPFPRRVSFCSRFISYLISLNCWRGGFAITPSLASEAEIWTAFGAFGRLQKEEGYEKGAIKQEICKDKEGVL